MFCQASLPPPLTSSSAAPTVTGGNSFYFLSPLVLFIGRVQRSDPSWSSERFPPWRHSHCSLTMLLNFFLHYYYFFKHTANMIEEEKSLAGASHWTVAIVVTPPGWPGGRGGGWGSAPSLCSPQGPHISHTLPPLDPGPRPAPRLFLPSYNTRFKAVFIKT